MPTRSLCPLLRFQFASLHDVGGAQGVIYCAPLSYFSIFFARAGEGEKSEGGGKIEPRNFACKNISASDTISSNLGQKSMADSLDPPPRFHIFSLFLFPPPCLGHTAATEEKRRQRLTRKGRKKGAKILAKKKLGNAFAHETLVISRNILLYRLPHARMVLPCGNTGAGIQIISSHEKKGGGETNK